MDFTVDFSENVTVTGTDSTLELTTGSDRLTAVNYSKTTNSITYRYTVQNGYVDNAGITGLRLSARGVFQPDRADGCSA